MSILKHIVKQPFIAATGAAAFVHSTWALATLFGGEAPHMQAGGWLTYLEFAYWIGPAMAIAFALDVGQIATSAQIRDGHKRAGKYATFAIFAIANYFLQWLYMSHHMPSLALAEGVRAQWQPLAELIRDASLWIIPAFLPLATLLYTLSDDHEAAPEAARQIELAIVPSLPNLPIAPEIPEYEGLTEQADETYLATCPHCEWQGVYATPYQAKQARNAHMRSHLPQKAFSTNGNH
jgi:hypothetical protein